jgi:hypothetical protein
MLPKIKDTDIKNDKDAIRATVQQLLTYVTQPLGKHDHSWGTGGDQGRYGAACVKPDGSYRLHYTQHPCHALMRDFRDAVSVFNQYGHRLGSLMKKQIGCISIGSHQTTDHGSHS